MRNAVETPAENGNTARVFALCTTAVLLALGTLSTIGALWLPWRHYVVTGDPSLVEPQDLASYVPMSDGWAHSFMVFTILALATGVLAWAAVHRVRYYGARMFALPSGLFAGGGIVFATLGIDGAAVWRSGQATDGGYFVCLAGYAVVIVASGVMFVYATVASARRS